MGIFDRIILTIYTFILTLFSLGIVAIALKLVTLELLWTSLQLNFYGRWEAALVGFVFFLVSVRLLVTGVIPGKGRQTIIQETPFGQVHIALAAIENLVQKVTRQIKGVRSVKTYIVNTNQGICIHLKAVVSPESCIPSISDEIQNRIKNYINHVVGTDVADIRIFVEDISNEVGGKPRSRVE
jgi:uncharacterized alkaline shock family protein YloU